MKNTNPMGDMRKEWLIRDGLDCVPCRDPRVGRCKCKLLSPTLNPVTYFKLDDLRTNHAYKLQLGHLRGRRHETWRDACAQCPCHNVGMTKLIREVCLEYTAQFSEEGTERFEAARALRPAQKTALKAKAKANRRASREFQKAKKRKLPPPHKHRGREPEAPRVKGLRLPSKTVAQMNRPVLNG